MWIVALVSFVFGLLGGVWLERARVQRKRQAEAEQLRQGGRLSCIKRVH
jgi:hypothetical protein